MERQKLQALLRELHQELGRSRSIDPESRRLLDQVLQDVESLADAGQADSPPSPADQLEQAALRLEAEHPKLAGLLGQIGDTLAKLGI